MKPAKAYTADTMTNLKRNHHRLHVLARLPVLGRHGCLVWESVGIQILLEQLRLPGHCKSDRLAQAVIVQAVKARDFTGADVAAALWHQPDATLRIWRLEGVDVVHKWWLGSHFKVSDHGVAFAAKEHQICVGIVEWEHHTVWGVQVNHHYGLWEGVGGTERVLTLGWAVEAESWFKIKI